MHVSNGFIWQRILRKTIAVIKSVIDGVFYKTQLKFPNGMRHKGDHLPFLSKRINDKTIFTTMMTIAASLPQQ